MPPHPSRILALRACRVNAPLDPGGSGKELVGKGSGTVRARLATVHARLVTVRARLSHSTVLKKGYSLKNQAKRKISKNRIFHKSFLKKRFENLTFSMFFQKYISLLEF